MPLCLRQGLPFCIDELFQYLQPDELQERNVSKPDLEAPTDRERGGEEEVKREK